MSLAAVLTLAYLVSLAACPVGLAVALRRRPTSAAPATPGGAPRPVAAAELHAFLEAAARLAARLVT